MVPAVSPDAPFSLTHGGPFYRLIGRLHLRKPDGRTRTLALVLLLWIPFVVAALVYAAAGRGWDRTFLDLTAHVRLLIALPLLLTAEHFLETRCELVGQMLRESSIVDRASLRAIFKRALQLRDARNVEATLAIIALLGGQAALWGITATGFMSLHTPHFAPASLPSYWHAGVALPVFQFLLMRWLWQWFVWCLLLARLSRLPLNANGLHPDCASGLKFLSAPVDAFAVFVACISSLAAASWLVAILAGRATLQSVGPTFLVFVVVALVIACGPLLLFSRQLYSAREREFASYTAFAHDYVCAFRARWLTGPLDDPATALGTSDLQSLADLGNGFRPVADAGIVPVSTRALLTIGIAAVLPMLPLIVASVPLPTLISHLGKALLGPLA